MFDLQIHVHYVYYRIICIVLYYLYNIVHFVYYHTLCILLYTLYIIVHYVLYTFRIVFVGNIDYSTRYHARCVTRNEECSCRAFTHTPAEFV